MATSDSGTELLVVAEDQLPDEARDTLELIDAGGPFPYDRDGVVFENREELLPERADGYYAEYTVPTPGADDRGARRIVAGRRRGVLLHGGPLPVIRGDRPRLVHRAPAARLPARRERNGGQMSGLAALLAGHTPPEVYQWHSAASVADVQHAVEHAGWCFRYLDGWTVEDRTRSSRRRRPSSSSPTDSARTSTRSRDSLSTTSTAGSTAWCCSGTAGARWPATTRRRSGGQAVLDKRAESDERGKLAVILRGEGPELDLEELPIKH